MDYEKQANDFMEKIGATMEVVYQGVAIYFPDDKEARDVYEITLKRNERKYTFTFGQSLNKSYHWVEYEHAKEHKKFNINKLSKDEYRYKYLKPTIYNVLACLTKYNPESHEDFCAEYGYDIDSRKGLDIYLAVQKEWNNVDKLFHDVMDELREIA